MSPTPLKLSWGDYDNALDAMEKKISDLIAGEFRQHVRGIYGVPRGGLMLAVPLSHRLNLPLLPHVTTMCIVVDDIIETGKTLKDKIGYVLPVGAIAWFTKIDTPHEFISRVPAERWVIFPWEPVEKAEADAAAYYASRQRNL